VARKGKVVPKRARRPPIARRPGAPLSIFDLSREYRLAPLELTTQGTIEEIERARSSFLVDLAWDGHRVLAMCIGKRVRLVSSDHREWHDTFPTIGMALERLASHELSGSLRSPDEGDVPLGFASRDVVIEGWICALGPDGLPSWELLRRHAQKQPQRIVFAVWDLLRLDGEDLRGQPLAVRRGRLATFLARGRDVGVLLASEDLPGSLEALADAVQSVGGRGIVAREAAAPYPTDGTAWHVIPCPATERPALERTLSPPPVVTNQDKLMFPRDAITKKDVVAYYRDIAETMLAHLKDRPIVAQRWPDGIDDFTWYQHRVPPRAPDYVRAVWIDKNRRIIAEHPDALAWLANQAVLTFHGWASRYASLRHPDWVVIDLDPGENTTWPQVIEVATALRKLLELLELPSVPKTSGQKGLHVLIPLAPGHTVLEAHELARRAGKMLTRVLPHLVSLESSIEARRGRLYVDHLQNFVGKTLVMPYSLRAVDGAPVSTPLRWSEITPSLDPRSFTLRTMRKRLDVHGDIAASLLDGTARIADVIGRMQP
jgi:DNA ligase D-like protein (predicted polymerase)